MIQQEQREEEQRRYMEQSGVISSSNVRHYREHDTLPIGQVLELHSLAPRPYEGDQRTAVQQPIVRQDPSIQAYARLTMRKDWDPEKHRQIMRAFDPDIGFTGPAVFSDNHPAYEVAQQYTGSAEKPRPIRKTSDQKPVFEDILRECGWVPSEERDSLF